MLAFEPNFNRPRPKLRTGERDMADRIALGKVGLTFLAITAAVMLMAAFVVKSHLDGRMTLEAGTPVTVASLPAGAR